MTRREKEPARRRRYQQKNAGPATRRYSGALSRAPAGWKPALQGLVFAGVGDEAEEIGVVVQAGEVGIADGPIEVGVTA